MFRVFACAMMASAMLFSALPALAGYYEYQATPNVAIPDDTCGTSSVTSQINVPSAHTIVDLNIGIILTHTYRGDLWIKLTSPASETITLFLDHSPGGTPGDSYNNLYGTFDESSVNKPDNRVNDATASYTNRIFYTYDYQNPSSIGLDNYIGDSALGTWTMTVCDDAGVDTGTLVSWALFITDDIPTTTTTTTTVPPTTTTTTIPSDDDTDDDVDDDFDDDVDDDFDDDADDDFDDDSDDDGWFPDDDDGGWFPDDDAGDDDDDDEGPNWPGGGGDTTGGSSDDDDDGGGGMCG